MIKTIKNTIIALTIGGLGSLTSCTTEPDDWADVEMRALAESDPLGPALGVDPPPPVGLAAPVSTDGTYYYVRAKHSDKCLHQHGGVLHNGGAITQWDCVDQYNVQWRFDPSPDPDYYYVRARHSGKCAHQHGHTYANGDPITQWDCIDQGNVKIRLIPASNNYYYMQFQHSGKCVHVHGASWDNGTPITQWTCINQPNVQWTFEPVGD